MCIQYYMENEVNESISPDNELIKNTPEIRVHSRGKLELGDIIEIRAPSNTEIHEKIFAIYYIDEHLIRLVNVSTYQTHTLHIHADQPDKFTDETIQQVNILCRCKEKGYARQHGLVTGQWIDIHFDGEVPTIISGEITNLEEDMFEITTYPERNVIYIDFEYKGLPQHLPFEKFVLRDRPESLGRTGTIAKRVDDYGEHIVIGEDPDGDEAYMEYKDTGEAVIHIPIHAQPAPTTREVLRSYYLEATEIIEEYIEDAVQMVEVPEHEKRYTIEAQLIDMTDEFISAVAIMERSPRVFMRIQNLIHKFKQLREQFSVFDNNDNVLSPKRVSAFHKPLVDEFMRLSTRLRWLMPVVKSQKAFHIYVNEPPIQQPDAFINYMKASFDRLSNIMKDYFKNADSIQPYDNMIRRLMSEHMAFRPTDTFREILSNNIPVKTDIEAVISNYDDYNSTTMKSMGRETRKRFSIQRFGVGTTKMVSDAKKQFFVRKGITPNDPMNVHSILVLPEQFIQYSRVELPGTPIAEKVLLSHQAMYLYRMLKAKTTIQTVIVSDLSKEVEYSGLTEDTAPGTTDRTAFIGNQRTIKEYVLDTDITIDETTLAKFLNVVFPKKQLMIEFAKHRIRGLRSVYDMVRILEPFMMYTTDITFSHYKEIRYFVKEEVKKYKASLKKAETQYRVLIDTKYNLKPATNFIETVLQSDKQLNADFRECYHLKTPPANPDKEEPAVVGTTIPFSAELLHQIYSLDGGKMYLRLINKHLLSLVTPEKILNSVEIAKLDDMTNMEKIRASDCFKRYIVKRYNSMEALRKDNSTPDVFYDKEFDDTPYDILKKYKDQKKEMLPELFFDYFREVLISKHDCPENMASELAQTILAGKKRVVDGYALLVLRPTMKDPDADAEEKLSPKEQEQIRIEADARKRMQYYKRVNDHWVRDDSVDETSFVDSNALFCDISRECIQTTPSKVCASTDTAAMRMKAINLNRMQNEFDRRVSLSLEEIQTSIDTSLKHLNNNVFRKRILANVLTQKFNDYAVSLGKRAVTIEHTESPYEPLRRMIMSQTDFVKKQSDIIRFVELYTREPMLDKNEEQYWLYCRETNIRLFPLSIYLLAKSFIQFDNYSETLDQICAQYGVLSADGDCIIDKHTYYVLRQIDFVAEEGYDEAGFRVITNKVMAKDVDAVLQEAFDEKEKVFDNEEMQYAYNVFLTICKHIKVSSGAVVDHIEEFALRITLEIMNNTDIVMTEKAYLKMVEKRAKKSDKEKQPIPYAIYRHQILIQTVASATAIAIMTLVPSFKSKKTFPGCIQSFRGFPVDAGEEDVSGLKYICCILAKSKSSIVPWNAIEPLSINTLFKRMKDFISGFLLKRPDVQQLCDIKREYLAKYPDETIPSELNVAKWIHFNPPLVEFHVAKTLQSIGADFKDELLRSMRDGSLAQFESIRILKQKLHKHVYGIVELIQAIVSKKELLLTTASKEPFLENACCNETVDGMNPLSYFIKEDATIDNYNKKIGLFSELLRFIEDVSKPAIMFHNERTGVERGELRPEIGEHIIYGAFIHYCNFDRDIPIPRELEIVCREKPAVYNRLDSLDTKIEKMKANGKRFTNPDLEHLMNIVNHQNRVSIYYGATPEEVSQISQFKNILEELDLHDSEVVDVGLRELLWKTLGEYNPSVMVNEEREINVQLNQYLDRANGRMFSKITEFLDNHGNLTNAQYEAIQVFIHEICVWKMDKATDTQTLYSVQRFVLNAIESIVKTFPQYIRNAHTIGLPWDGARHWRLSQKHNEDLNEMIFQFYRPFDKYFKNKTLNVFLENIYTKLSPLVLFVKQLPLFMPIVKDDVEFHALYSKETVYLLLKYAWYSVLYEYIVGVEDPDILEISRRENNTIRRENNERQNELFGATSVSPASEPGEEDIDAEYNPMVEIELELGNVQQIKDTVGSLMVDLLKLFRDTKEASNMSYDEIRFKTQRKKDKEKKQITDAFAKMERDERKVEDMLKSFKIGRWNLGMQKSLFKYKADTYARQKQLNQFLNQDDQDQGGEEPEQGGIELNMGNTEIGETEFDIEDLERDEQNEIEREYQVEANDIGDLGEDYQDGNYYTEDNEDDF